MDHSNYYLVHTCMFVCFSEFYEDILSIICTCTCFEISQSMWSVYYMLYEAFQRDAFDYFAGKKRLVSSLNLFFKKIAVLIIFSFVCLFFSSPVFYAVVNLK